MSYQPNATAGVQSYDSAREVRRFPGLICTLDFYSAPTNTAPGINVATGVRCQVPETGSITSMAVWISLQNGNIDLGIYDTGATTRKRLGSSGSTACGAAGWQIINMTALVPVRAGDYIELAFASDSATVSIDTGSMNHGNASGLPTGYGLSPQGGKNVIAWVASTSFALPATLAESAMSATGAPPLLYAKYA